MGRRVGARPPYEIRLMADGYPWRHVERLRHLEKLTFSRGSGIRFFLEVSQHGVTGVLGLSEALKGRT